MIKFTIDSEGGVPKFQQIVAEVIERISDGTLERGARLPSVNEVCRANGLSRDTVFKAYRSLKEQGIIDSVPNKGYFIAREEKRVLLFLDTLKAYKEVLYDSFLKSLRDDVMVDVHFHHYNVELFDKFLRENVGKYHRFIVMPFDDQRAVDAMDILPKDRTLVVDWKIGIPGFKNYLYQDFRTPVYLGLEKVEGAMDRYDELVMVYPNYTNHPYETVQAFESFCMDKKKTFTILKTVDTLEVKKGVCYFSVSDRMLGRIIEQCKSNSYVLGEDVGILSYNETPMKKFVDRGISVISTDFEELGVLAARFANDGEAIDYCVPTKVFLRESL
ncbi:GntR family transcriptional regulator [Halosquirtibacter xylanolyticus]|uniref:GntR family transcriptional regulator n=1 Tax=Halosquirtibacter xylanolyticus TaxID=3374599 RepID=UPI003748E516|nr:GntR family transcriptional regulator [Prolixibacteraceae bacterium]